ncbi:ABC transporter permease [Boseaceae bacterium BT-24-1]|nr:ABC transporter permease [Boseaceae bacterium BT-24-1]
MKENVVSLASFVVIIVIWWVVATFGSIPAFILPSPVAVVSATLERAVDGLLWSDSLASASRVLIGFLIAAATALPLGILMGASPLARAAAEPLIGFIRYMPVSAFLPLTLIWAGIEEAQKWLLIWIGTFFSQTMMFMDAVKRVPVDLLNVGHTLGFSKAKILRRIILPWAMPGIWDALRITLAWSWSWLILAELVAAGMGLGYRMSVDQRYLRTAEIFSAVIFIGLIGLASDQMMKFAGRKLFSWAEGGKL